VKPDAITFHVEGTPRPQGSLTVWRTPEGRKAHIAHAGGVPFLRWRASVTTAALLAFTECPPFTGPVAVSLTFALDRKGGGGVYPVGHPDLDKLTRAVLDALGGVAYADDSQVVVLSTRKAWGVPEGVHVEVASAITMDAYPVGDPYANA